MTHRSTLALLSLCLAAACLASGCGGSDVVLTRVEGMVTLDGEPLSDAEVVYRPKGRGRPSFGRTDEGGHYTLSYLEGQEGALAGAHTVTISTLIEPDSDSDDPVKQQGRPERVPAQYNVKTTLEEELNAGELNVKDFDLATTRAR
ncbi:MAG: hypothetical protein KF774_03340 [Planctomyces sp.]|nr:hypothetical protein [Planctomyces sp.]